MTGLKLSFGLGITVQRYGRLVLLVTAASSCASGAVLVPSSPPAASTTRDYGRIEAQVLDALNRARTNPAATSAELEKLTTYYDGKRFQRPTWPVAVITNEGVAAAREAVAAVRGQSPVPALTLSEGLTRAARDHAADQAKSGIVGHTGADGSTVATRASRYGTWLVSISENIDYQPMVEGRDVIESLLVDDGVPDRGHRRNIYDPTARLVGIGCGPHPRFTAMCVIVQAGGFREK